MNKATLQFLRAERDRMQSEAELLRRGHQTVYRSDAGQNANVTSLCLKQVQDQIARYDEHIAAIEARIW